MKGKSFLFFLLFVLTLTACGTISDLKYLPRYDEVKYDTICQGKEENVGTTGKQVIYVGIKPSTSTIGTDYLFVLSKKDGSAIELPDGTTLDDLKKQYTSNIVCFDEDIIMENNKIYIQCEMATMAYDDIDDVIADYESKGFTCK